MSIRYGWYLIDDGLESTANLGGRSTAAYGTRVCSTSATVQRRRLEMIGTANWRRRYLWRANPPTWSECHFRPPQRLRRLAESSLNAAQNNQCAATVPCALVFLNKRTSGTQSKHPNAIHRNVST